MTLARRLLPLSLGVAIATGFSTTHAGELTNFSAMRQADFLALSKDLSAATSTKAIEPAAPLGLSGFDVSAAATLTQVQAGSVWTQVAGSNPDQLMQTKLSVSKGLPWGVDVGAFASKVPTSNISASGFHVKYALFSGHSFAPALALRASHSRMGGVSAMDLSNTGYEVLVSKGFLGLTPYAGLGVVHSTAKVNGTSTLSTESFNQHKVFVGASWTMLLLNFSTEYDRTGASASYALKAGLRF